MMDIIFFNVGLGQCVFFYPRNNPEYSLMVDVGHTDSVNPVDFLLGKNFFHKNGLGLELGNLTITNYDHDHYSNLHYLKSKVKIRTTRFPKNLTPEEIDALKPVKTDALAALLDIRKTYTSSASDHNPPYEKTVFCLNKDEFEKENVSTNELSQMVFVKYNGTTICLSGDLEKDSWEIILKKTAVQNLLKSTDVFIAGHHGRINGYHEDIFKYCTPECIIMSDKEIIHGTQENTSSLYGKHISGEGIDLVGNQNKRKVLTTRNDGNIWIRIETNGTRTYNNFSI
jgi:hypothetical protein